MNIKFIIKIILLSVSQFAFGHFFRAELFYNRAHKQFIYTFADAHISSDDNNKKALQKQQNDIITHARTLNALVIAEDPYIINEDDIAHDASGTIQPGYLDNDFLQKVPKTTPLQGLTSLCQLNAVNNINVEKRLTTQRPLNVYFKYLANKKNIIRTEYTDGKLFENYYTKRLEWLSNVIEQPCAELFDYLKENSSTITELMQQDQNIPEISTIDTVFSFYPTDSFIIDQTYKEKIFATLRRYGSTILDIDILHNIARNQDLPYIFVSAGDYHIKRLQEALQECDYEFIGYIGSYSNSTQDPEPHALSVTEAIDKLDKQFVFKTLLYSFFSMILSIMNQNTTLHLWGT